MKIVKTILFYLGITVASLVALVFAFVELRSLFAGDFTLMHDGFAYLLGSIFRSLYFLSIIALGVFHILFRIKKKPVCIVLFALCISLLIGAFLSFIFYDYFITLAIIFINLILATITFIGFFKKEVTE